MENRSIYKNLWDSFKELKQMVFISGPRQTGKTTFAKQIKNEYNNSRYFNWDIPDQKQLFIEDNLFYEKLNRVDAGKALIILDEIHKYPDWKNYLKGIYDRDAELYKFLVTGSGRLNLYRKGSDSLAGRYFLFHIWPFTIAELGNKNRSVSEFLENPLSIDIKNIKAIQNIWQSLNSFSGFPDPFLQGKKTFYNRWSGAYQSQIIKEDVRDLTGIKKIAELEMLVLLLQARAGNIVSMNNLARDLKISFDSVKSWMEVLEVFYICFRIAPYSKKISRAIKKEKKVYFFNCASIKDEGAKFENMLALELFRLVHSLTEQGLGQFALHYIRTKDGVEVDFLLTKNYEPFLLIESKLSSSEATKSLRAIQNLLQVPAVQLVSKSGVYKIVKNNKMLIASISADQWLASLP